MPDLIRQEIESLSVYLDLLFRLQGDPLSKEGKKERAEREKIGEEKILTTVVTVLEQYVTKTIKPTLLPEAAAEYRAFTPVVTQILNGIVAFSDAQFLKATQGAELYEILTDLMLSTHLEVRTLLHKIFSRIGAMCVL
jgi:hypothetical protein